VHHLNLNRLNKRKTSFLVQVQKFAKITDQLKAKQYLFLFALAGVDLLRTRMLTELAEEISYIVAELFNTSLLSREQETSGLFRSDGKRPDGLTLVPGPGRAVKRYVETLYSNQDLLYNYKAELTGIGNRSFINNFD